MKKSDTNIRKCLPINISCRFQKFFAGCTSETKSIRIYFMCCLLMICAITAYIGATPTHKFGHDIFFLLDNSWRVLNGQRPQLDFSSAWGPVTFLIYALGLKISNFAVNGIGYANALVGLAIGLWSYGLGRDRLQYPFRILFSLFMVGLVVAPYALSFGVLKSTHAMVYNRFGYGLIGLILLESIQSMQRQEKETKNWSGGFSTGVAVALLLFLKISYFFASLLVIVGVTIIYIHFDRNRITGLFVGFSLVTIAFLYYLAFDLHSIFSELQMAAGARSESLNFYYLLKKFTYSVVFLPLVILFGFISSMALGRNYLQKEYYQTALIGALVFLTDICLIFTNQQWNELPLIACFVLIVINNSITDHGRGQNMGYFFTNGKRIILLMAGATVFLPIFIFQFVSLAHAALEKRNPPELSSITRFSQPHLRDLILYEGETSVSNGRQYTTYINEGVALLIAVSNKNEKVLTIDMFNPFPFALGRMPPTGGIAAAAYRYTLSDTYRPSDDKYFGDSDIVMVPKKPAAGDGYYYGFLKIYEPALKKNYSLVAQNDWWDLYRRNQ